jgi:hypothetical protein
MTDKDQRRSERHRVRFHLVYDDGGSFNAGTVRDVSEGGLFLETALPLPIGTIVTLTPLDSAGKTLLEVKARVARSLPYDPDNFEQHPGMGLQFLHLDDGERRNVVALIRHLEEEASRDKGELDPFLGVKVMPRRITTLPPPKP